MINEDKYIFLETGQINEAREFLAICQILKISAEIYIKDGGFEFAFDKIHLRRIKEKSTYLTELIDNKIYMTMGSE